MRLPYRLTSLELCNRAVRADYNKAIELDPLYTFAYSNRGNVYRAKGDLDLALADYNKAIQLESDDMEMYLSRGYIHYLLKHIEDALDDFETVCRLDQNNPVGQNNRAFVLFQLGRIEDAEAAWKIATDLPNALDYAFAGHAVSLQKLGNRDLAKKQYQTAIKMDVRWRDDLATIAKEYLWSDDMVDLANEILKGSKRK